MNKVFRIMSQHWLLTFPRCAISVDAMYEHLEDLLDLDEYIIATERHQDGGRHLHCWIRTRTVRNVKNPRFFDYYCDDGTSYHPNV